MLKPLKIHATHGDLNLLTQHGHIIRKAIDSAFLGGKIPECIAMIPHMDWYNTCQENNATAQNLTAKALREIPLITTPNGTIFHVLVFNQNQISEDVEKFFHTEISDQSGIYIFKQNRKNIMAHNVEWSCLPWLSKAKKHVNKLIANLKRKPLTQNPYQVCHA